jgi:hypothetical protein
MRASDPSPNVVAWENLGTTPIAFGDVATVIRDAIKAYEP